jgi:hypothetical protein
MVVGIFDDVDGQGRGHEAEQFVRCEHI